MEQLLKLSRDTLAANYPALDPALLDKAILLALAGRVNITGPEKWTVKSQSSGDEYRVEGRHGWACTCPAPGPEIDDLLGRKAGRVCKHILAAAICSAGVGLYIDPPASVWELLERVVRGQVAPGAPVQGKLESLALPGTKARLVRPYRSDGREVLCLKVGRTMSAPLVEWRTNRSGQENVGQWQLTTKAREAYERWVEEVRS